MLLGGKDSLKELCSQLENTEYEDVRIILGSRLSYEEEEIIEGNITRFKNREVDSLSIAYFKG